MSRSETERSKSEMVDDSLEVNYPHGEHQVTELKIPVPWGHIAARVWGDSSHEPVLALHGTMDNAASFDHLLPLLPGGHFYFVCLDLPGHGHSSHLPAGVMYRVFDFVTVVRVVVEHFKWRQFSFLCHSLGGIVAYFFASAFPDLVKKMVVIDFVSGNFLPKEYHVFLIRHFYEKLLETEKKVSTGTPPTYTFEEAVQALTSRRPSALNSASARTLLLRELKKLEDGRYMFRKDQRLKWLMYPIIDDEQYVAMLSLIKCPLLLILCKQSSVKDCSSKEKLVSTFKRNCPVFRCELVDGGHDIHLNDASVVAPSIINFLYTAHSSL